MMSELEPRQAMKPTDAMSLTELRDSKHDVQHQTTSAIELPPASLRSEGMPISVQASNHPPAEKDLGATSATNPSSTATVAQPERGRRESADLEALEQKSRKHSMTISEDSSSPIYERSNWPLLYQMIDVDPTTDEIEFPEKARRSLIRLSLKHGPPVLTEHPEAEERWAVITEAYDALSDPEQKKLYDMQSTSP